MKKVVVVSYNEDGDPARLEELSRDEFLRQLNDGVFGEEPVFLEPGEKFDPETFVGYVLIDGPIIAPKPVEKVKKFTL